MDVRTNGGGDDERRAGRPRRSALVVLGVGIAAVALIIGGTLVSGPPTSPQPTSTVAGTTAPTVGTPAPSPVEAWSEPSLPPFTPVAELRAERTDAAGVALDTAFSLASLTGGDPGALAADLETTPKLELSVVPGPTPASVTLRPAAPLAPGQVYRFTLRNRDGSLAGSWAFQARAPLHVVTTLPGNRTTGVPTRTGIEVTFDQDGAADMGPYFAIVPPVDGRFERHARTQVFVPDGLREQTVYTVTIRRGLVLRGTDLTLEKDVRFQFETAGPERAPAVRMRIGRDVLETSPAERPVIGLQVEIPEEESGPPPKPPRRVEVRVYRFPSLSATISQLRRFLDAPRWAEWTDPLIPTTGLPRVLRFTANLRQLGTSSDQVIVFPSRLPKGWYLVDIGSKQRTQAFLQVTAVSAWVAVLSDRTIVWVNDTATGRAIPNAAVRVDGGPALGRTDRDGLLDARTPAALVPSASALPSKFAAPPGDATSVSPILVVRAPGGGAAFVPFDLDRYGGAYRGEWWLDEPGRSDGWWSLLSTERSLYRQGDRVQAWGFLRGRSDGRIPGTVELRLVSSANENLEDPPVVARAVVHPNRSGAFAAALELAGAPLGPYVLETLVDGRPVSRTWLDVGIIRKPIYQLSLTPARRAAISGDQVAVTVEARFFDGQPVPATSFAVRNDNESGVSQIAGPTDPQGRATVEFRPTWPSDVEGASGWSIEATPARPEEGEIVANASILVFPSAVNLQADALVRDGRLVVTGSLHRVDLARIERELAAGRDAYEIDPDGKAIRGATVTARVTELIPVRRLAGYDYDYINKMVVPRHEYTTRRNPLRTITLKTGAGGAIRLAMAIPAADHQYEVVLRTTDGAGRTERRTIFAARPFVAQASRMPVFEASGVPRDQRFDRFHAYRIGEPVRLTMTDGVRPLPSGGSNRYLYIVAQQGLRAASVSTSPRFVRRFSDRDAPGVFVIGVRFTGRTYAPKADTWAMFDTRERRLTVKLSSDRARYRPGEEVTVAVRTTDARGRPVAATVTLRAVDEKLFALGGAAVIDPLADLYARIDSGIVRLTATHQLPIQGGPEGEGGATGGGDEGRADFRDTLLFRQLDTNASGQATVTFRLSDDLTSWHLSASAITRSLRAGEGQLLLPVGLPFFVEATIADEYLASDRPAIRLRAFGGALVAGDPVEFTVASESLGIAPTHLTGTAFTDVEVPLPPLSVGRHAITIEGTATTRTGAGGAPLADRLTRTFGVVRSRLTAARVEYATLTADLRPAGGADLATYTFSDAGRGRFLPILESLAASGGGRVDRALAQAIAHDLLVREFGRDPATLPPADFDPSLYPIGIQESAEGVEVGGGIPLLPYGGPDTALAVRIALIASDRFDAAVLRDTLLAVRDQHATTRELRIAINAGLAALGVPVLADLASAAAESDLTIRERIYLALAFQASGDDATALTIEHDLLERHGEQLGAWTRLRVGDVLDDTVEATALLSLVAAGIGDPVAPSLAAYVEANPAHDALHVLDEVGYVARALEWTPAAAASFAYTVDRRREVVTLEAGESLTLALTAAQRESLRLEPLTGQVGVAASWSEPVDTATLRPDPGLTLKRTVTPAGTIPTDTFVVVELTPTFGILAVEGCYEIVDLVPSGLAPVVWTDAWVGDDGTIAPYSVVGQRVAFCAPNDPTRPRVARMRYLARIVTPGDYAWEPALMQLAGGPQPVAFVPPTRVTIGAR